MDAWDVTLCYLTRTSPAGGDIGDIRDFVSFYRFARTPNLQPMRPPQPPRCATINIARGVRASASAGARTQKEENNYPDIMITPQSTVHSPLYGWLPLPSIYIAGCVLPPPLRKNRRRENGGIGREGKTGSDRNRKMKKNVKQRVGLTWLYWTGLERVLIACRYTHLSIYPMLSQSRSDWILRYLGPGSTA